MAEVINHTYKLKRATAARWEEVNPILAQGEPGFVYDKNLLKIGDGFTPWMGLPYIGEGESSGIISVDKAEHFPAIGNPDVLYRAIEERQLYQWNNNKLKYESLTSGEVDLDEVYDYIDKNIELRKYEVFARPVGTCVKIDSYEVRIMCPEDTEWTFQNGKNPNQHYVGVKIYAPTSAYSFKEDLAEHITDETMYYFTNNDFAGIDTDGRKYSIIWLPVANYDSETEEWTYYGARSTTKKYVGWYYTVEWYNQKGVKIHSETIRINLSNEQCHNSIEPYYIGNILEELNDKVEISLDVDEELLIFTTE